MCHLHPELISHSLSKRFRKKKLKFDLLCRFDAGPSDAQIVSSLLNHLFTVCHSGNSGGEIALLDR